MKTIKWRRLFRGRKKNYEVAPDEKCGKKKPSLTINTGRHNGEEAMPRISMELTMTELEDEALARGIERQFLPATKVDLLAFLVDGSIYLRKTKAWMDVERLKGAMADDCRRIEEEREEFNSREDMNSRGEDRWICQHSDEERASLENNSTSVYDNKAPTRADDHTASLSRSTCEDDDHFPPASITEFNTPNDGMMPGPITLWDREASTTTMDMTSMSSIMSSRGPGRYRSIKLKNRTVSFQSIAAPEDSVMGNFIKALTCTTNVCRTSTGVVNDKEVVHIPKNMAEKIDFDNEEDIQEIIGWRTQWEETPPRTKEQMELQQKWDAFNQFEAWIIAPPSKNKIPTGSMMKGYTVWCNTSRNPPKLFDTTYKNLNDANARARYLFYWRNPWRLPPSKMADVVLIKSDNSAMSGCSSTFHCVHPNGEKWIVSVVNDSTFRYLDNASLERHDLDQTEEF